MTALLALVVGLGSFALIDPNEPVYAQTGIEMLQRGDWLVPWYHGQPWFDKPVLFFALEGAFQGVLGRGVLAARLPSALAALLLSWILMRVGRRWFGGGADAWAGFIFMTSIYAAVAGRAAVTDMVFTASLLAGVLGLGEILARPRASWALPALALALATLTKGPVVFALLMLQALGYCLWTRSAAPLKRGRIWAAVLGALALSLPWYVYMASRFRENFLGEFLGRQNITRYLSPEHPEAGPLYFLIVLPLMFLPWTLFAARFRAVAEPKESEGFRPVAYLATWVVVVVLFFSVSASKLVSYVLPAIPALALLLGAALERSSAAWRRGALAAGMLSATALAATALFVAPRLVCYYSAAARAHDLRDLGENEDLLIYKGGYPGTLYYSGRLGTALRGPEDLGAHVAGSRPFRLLVRVRHLREIAPYRSRLVEVPGPSGPWGPGLELFRFQP